ncbi:MAG: phage tail protein [Rhodobiaceae bacterium]|nr:phage tail protein [Rhodobiaceae bacterium]
MMLAALGKFRFEVLGLPLMAITRKGTARLQPQMIVGRRPSLHFTGPDVEIIDLKVLIYPEVVPGTGLEQIEGLYEAMNAGRAMPFAATNGRYYGRWAIRNIDETRSYFDQYGQPQKVELAVQLANAG